MALAEIDVQASDRTTTATRTGNRIVTSAVAELFWVTFFLASDKSLADHRIDIPADTARRMRKRARDFWADGECACFTELFILAGRGGHLEDSSNEAFIAALPRLSQERLEKGILRSETEGDRAIIRARLARLRDDPETRRRYARFISDAWKLVRGRWETEGLAEVRRTADGWRQQVERGTPLLTVTMPAGVSLGALVMETANEAVAEGRLLVAPTYFGGGYSIVDGPAGTLLSTSGERAHPARAVRSEAEKVSPRFRALADPTRLAILSMLNTAPCGISEVARRLELSQPTVSAHFNSLRTAGLLVAHAEGRAVRYGLDTSRLDDILGEVRRLVVEGSC